LKQFSNGLDDYDYLRLYEEAVGKEATRDLVISKVFTKAKDNPYSLFQKGDAYSESPRPMEEVRKVIGEYLSQHPIHHKYGRWQTAVHRQDDEHPGMDVRTCSLCGAQDFMDHYDDLTTVEINMDKVNESDLDTSDMVQVLTDLSGIESDKLKFDVEVNSEGKVEHILVYVPTQVVAAEAVATINDCAGGNSTNSICKHDFFNHAESGDIRVYVSSKEVEDLSGASSANVFMSLITILLVIVSYY